MTTQNKKLEIINIHDIKEMKNNTFSKKTNHYLQKTLYNLRIVFRYNANNLEDLIDLYYYIEDILKNNIPLDEEELKILIYRITDLILNIEQYELHGETILIETISHLQQALYNQLETYKLLDKSHKDKLYSNNINNQIKNQEVEFKALTKILDEDNLDNIKNIVTNVLANNYQQEYLTYESRKDYLEY